MLDKLRREYAQLLTSGAQLLLVLVGIHQHSRNGWLACFSAIALVSVFAWLSSLYRLRAIRGNPISKIGSAAQGYVELLGQGRPFGDAPLLSALRRRPCLWYRYKIEKREFPQWNMKESGESSDSFILRDDTGECAVDPEHAEIFTMHCDRWHEEDCRYTEWKLIEHDQLFVAGHFRTIGGNTLEFDSHAELSALLAEWKKDMPALLARFDLDKDGVLDMNEWFLARQAAKREVEQAMREARAHPEINIVGRPVLSDQQPSTEQAVASLPDLGLGTPGDLLRVDGRARLGAAARNLTGRRLRLDLRRQGRKPREVSRAAGMPRASYSVDFAGIRRGFHEPGTVG